MAPEESSVTRRPSFDQFYDETYDAVLKFAWLIGGNASSAEDAVQDAYLALINRYDRIEKPAAYLRIVVVNNLKTRGTRQQREQDRLQFGGWTRPEVANDSPSELAHSVMRLPRKERIAIVCRYWLDLPEDEIAAMLGVRSATVRTLVKRAIARLRLEVEQ